LRNELAEFINDRIVKVLLDLELARGSDRI
jgi:hypothetical protein